jgi:PAS domain S-box-containing protein
LESEQQRILQAERELDAWHDRYIDLYDFTPVGYLTLNRAGCIVNVNRTGVQLFGYERRHLVGMPLIVLVAKPDRAAFSQHLLKARNATEKQATAELWFSRKGGQSVLLQLASLRSRETTPGVFRIHTAITDITEQHGAAEAQRRLAVLVAYSDDAIIGTSLNGIVTSWNQGAERLFGHTAGEIVGKSIKILIPPERQREETKILREIGRGRSTRHYETLRRHKNGSQIPISLTVSPVRDATGQAQ